MLHRLFLCSAVVVSGFFFANSTYAQEPCSFADVVGTEQLDSFFNLLPSLSPEVADILADAGMTSAETLDWEGIYLVLEAEAEHFGDGLPDVAQIQLVEVMLCAGGVANLGEDFEYNKALFLADAALLGATVDVRLGFLNIFSDYFAAYLGTSQAAIDNAHNIIIQVFGAGSGGLPSYADYRVYGTGSKTVSEPFSSTGDLDGDGISNIDEYNAVLAAGGNLEIAILAMSNDSPFWPGNPALPVAKPLALGILVAIILLLGMRMARKS